MNINIYVYIFAYCMYIYLCMYVDMFVSNGQSRPAVQGPPGLSLSVVKLRVKTIRAVVVCALVCVVV